MCKIYYPNNVKNLVIEYMNKEWISITEFCNRMPISRSTYYTLMEWKKKYIKDSTIDKLKKLNIIRDN